MIQVQSNLQVADNSGARRVQCIRILKKSKATERDHSKDKEITTLDKLVLAESKDHSVEASKD